MLPQNLINPSIEGYNISVGKFVTTLLTKKFSTYVVSVAIIIKLEKAIFTEISRLANNKIIKCSS